MISARRITHVRNGRSILRDVTFDVARGQGLGIARVDGDGHSTLLRILATYERPTSGSVLIGDVDAFATVFHVRSRIAYADATCAAAAGLRVDEYLELVARTRRRDDTTPPQVGEAIARAGLSGSRRVEGLGSAERSALALTGALVAKPDVLVLDEPFERLYPSVRLTLASWVSDMRHGGCALVLAAGNDDLGMLCQRIVRLVDGQVVEWAG